MFFFNISKEYLYDIFTYLCKMIIKYYYLYVIGSLPTQIGNLTALVDFHLHTNSFSGIIIVTITLQ